MLKNCPALLLNVAFTTSLFSVFTTSTSISLNLCGYHVGDKSSVIPHAVSASCIEMYCSAIDQCAERVEAIAHDGRVLSGCSLNSLLDSKGLSHSTGSIPSSPDHSCEITVFRMIPCLRPKSLTDSQHGFQLLCLLLVHF